MMYFSIKSDLSLAITIKHNHCPNTVSLKIYDALFAWIYAVFSLPFLSSHTVLWVHLRKVTHTRKLIYLQRYGESLGTKTTWVGFGKSCFLVKVTNLLRLRDLHWHGYSNKHLVQVRLSKERLGKCAIYFKARLYFCWTPATVATSHDDSRDSRETTTSVISASAPQHIFSDKAL